MNVIAINQWLAYLLKWKDVPPSLRETPSYELHQARILSKNMDQYYE